jgi:hypothetical protein
MNELQDIQDWFQNHCNDEWEHSQGIQIETCDNPGWWVHIELKGTPLADKDFIPISKGVSNDKMDTSEDWIHCEVKDHVFDAAGDPSKLGVILRTFLEWAKTK